MEDRAIVQCTTCGTPGTVIFENGIIKNAFFLCKCPRPSVEEANREGSRESRRDHGVSSR